jgi:hypothetical protein
MCGGAGSQDGDEEVAVIEALVGPTDVHERVPHAVGDEVHMLRAYQRLEPRVDPVRGAEAASAAELGRPSKRVSVGVKEARGEEMEKVGRRPSLHVPFKVCAAAAARSA